MEEAPTPNSFKENINNKKDDLESFDLYTQNSFGLFQIVVTKFNDYIEIKCKDITDESKNNKTHSNKFNSKSIKEIMGENNINEAYQILKNIPPQNVLIEQKDNIIIFSTKSSIFKKSFLLYEDIDINDSLALINQLRNENNNLKNRLDEIEKKFEIMNLNCEYNLFDVEVHKLENIFQQLTNNNNSPFNLHTPLIKKRAELGLINKGIKRIFNKNIALMDMIYCSKNDGDAPDNFKKNYNENLIYSVIIISTKDENPKKFGIFCNKQKNNSFNLNKLIKNSFVGLKGIKNYQNPFNPNINNFNPQNQNMNPIFLQNQNNMMKNNMMMNMNNNDIIIFDSNSISNKYFVFSLDDFSIYYSNESNYFPIISIKYNNQFKCLFGNENNINDMCKMNNSFNNNTSSFKLSGNNQFNIEEYELYAINI